MDQYSFVSNRFLRNCEGSVDYIELCEILRATSLNVRGEKNVTNRKLI